MSTTPEVGTAALILTAVLLISSLVERLVELYIKPLIPARLKGTPIEDGTISVNIVPYVTGLVGIAFCLLLGLDLLTPVLEPLDVEVKSAVAGQIITGLLFGGGSNLIHVLWPVPIEDLLEIEDADIART